MNIRHTIQNKGENMERHITQVLGEATTGTFSNLARQMFKLQQDTMEEKEIKETWEEIQNTWELGPCMLYDYFCMYAVCLCLCYAIIPLDPCKISHHHRMVPVFD